MRREFSWYRVRLLGALGVVLAADLALGVIFYRADFSVHTPDKELSALSAQRKLLQADVTRARNIRKDMPKTKEDCVNFENTLPSSANGYSHVSAELTELGHKSGLQLGALTFRQKDLPGKGVAEIAIDATVEGNYKGVVRFLNGLQRSGGNYIVEDLSLATDVSGQIPGQVGAHEESDKVKVTLHLTSFFKAPA